MRQKKKRSNIFLQEGRYYKSRNNNNHSVYSTLSHPLLNTTTVLDPRCAQNYSEFRRQSLACLDYRRLNVQINAVKLFEVLYEFNHFVLKVLSGCYQSNWHALVAGMSK
mmetsp:Transcript_16948/g.26443  ORF Transcript_16948/g.26443 Transcript_16948/m.26443 type:complete len:109 (+) Transcript_16948:2196-2522(+)